MARTKRVQRYYKRNKANWSTRISNIEGSQLATGNSNFVIYYNLCQNPAQTDTTISNKYTVKNIDLQLELSFEGVNANPDLEDFQWFVIAFERLDELANEKYEE